MTREKAKEICDMIETHGIEIIKAYGEGKVIQHLNLDGEWVDCDMPISFVNNHSFRVKPKETDYSCNCKGCKHINLESIDEPCCNCVDSNKYEKEKWGDILLKDCAVYDKKIAEEYTTLQEQIAKLKERNAELKGMYAHSAREAETYKQFFEKEKTENAELKKELEVHDKWAENFKQKHYDEIALKEEEINYLSEQIQELKIELDTPESIVLDKLDEAKEIIKLLLGDLRNRSYEPVKDLERAEQFLKENTTYERIQKAKYNYID